MLMTVLALESHDLSHDYWDSAHWTFWETVLTLVALTTVLIGFSLLLGFTPVESEDDKEKLIETEAPVEEIKRPPRVRLFKLKLRYIKNVSQFQLVTQKLE